MVEENRSRQQIISDNIVYYIKKNNMKQVDFYTSLNINKQDFSKKKNNKGSSFSTDEIYIAAKTLNVTVNDLYYSEEEKKEISVLKEEKYNPIMAQKQIEIKHLNSSFKDPISVLSVVIGLTIILSIVNYFLVKESSFWILTSLFIPVFALYDFKSSFGVEKTYMINYLDDVYYKSKNEKNKHYDACFIMHLLAILLICICLILILFDKFYIDYFPDYLILFIIVGFIIMIISTVTLIFYSEKKMKKKIYQYEIKGYTSKLVNVVAIAVFTVFGIALINLNINKCWYIALMTIFALMLSIVEFVLTSKKYSEYTLVYQKYGEDEVELFPENYEM